jgi:hypothetical protein
MIPVLIPADHRELNERERVIRIWRRLMENAG